MRLFFSPTSEVGSDPGCFGTTLGGGGIKCSHVVASCMCMKGWFGCVFLHLRVMNIES